MGTEKNEVMGSTLSVGGGGPVTYTELVRPAVSFPD